MTSSTLVCADANRGPSAAEEATGSSLTYGWPLAGDSGVIVVADNGVVNVAVGPGRRKIEAQRAALEALQDAGAKVIGVAVIVDRGASDAVRMSGSDFRAAYTLADLGLTA